MYGFYDEQSAAADDYDYYYYYDESKKEIVQEIIINCIFKMLKYQKYMIYFPPYLHTKYALNPLKWPRIVLHYDT